MSEAEPETGAISQCQRAVNAPHLGLLAWYKCLEYRMLSCFLGKTSELAVSWPDIYVISPDI